MSGCSGPIARIQHRERDGADVSCGVGRVGVGRRGIAAGSTRPRRKLDRALSFNSRHPGALSLRDHLK
jgi:hypothetical protein